MWLKAIYRWRGFLASLPVIFSFFCFLGEYENRYLIWTLGLLLFTVGWAMRLWTQKHLGYRLRIKRTVTTSGPYALVRNPIYIGNTLIILGTVVMLEVVWMLPIALLWCALLYSLVVRYEEHILAAKFGQEYLRYMASVPRWLPRLAKPQGSPRFHSSVWQILGAEVYVLFIIAVPLVKNFLIAPFVE
jgi:protein-S-isoprenylcysteine O-methyltransferase Ste14